MSGPAKAGVFIYAKDLPRLSEFYQAVLSMTELHATPEVRVLQSPDIQLVIHAIPEEIASTIVIESPPEWRENTALKFFFTVDSMEAARSQAASLGGEVSTKEWPGSGFTLCNACDPEGNIFQLRETSA